MIEFPDTVFSDTVRKSREEEHISRGMKRKKGSDVIEFPDDNAEPAFGNMKKSIARKREGEVIDVSDDESDCCIVEPASKKGKEPKG